jgi:hypothetical protein
MERTRAGLGLKMSGADEGLPELNMHCKSSEHAEIQSKGEDAEKFQGNIASTVKHIGVEQLPECNEYIETSPEGKPARIPHQSILGNNYRRNQSKINLRISNELSELDLKHAEKHWDQMEIL